VRTGRIEWKVSRDSWSAGDSSDDEDSDTDEGGEGGGYSSGSNEDVLTAKTALDAEGKATLAIPTEFVGRDQMYSVNAEVMDASGQTVANETYFVATAGPFYLRATWANYIYKVGAPGSLSVVAMNYDGIAVPGVAFTASLHRVETLLPGQNESEHIEREVLRLSGRTGTDGCSELQFVAPAEGACSFIVETRSTAASSTSVSHS
jgi:hypothetical protein